MAFSTEVNDLQREVNALLNDHNLPYSCESPVEPDGNCFYLHGQVYELKIHLHDHVVVVVVVHVTIKPRL